MAKKEESAEVVEKEVKATEAKTTKAKNETKAPKAEKVEKTAEEPKKEVKKIVRPQETNITVGVPEPDISCPHCAGMNDNKVTNTYPNGNFRTINVRAAACFR